MPRAGHSIFRLLLSGVLFAAGCARIVAAEKPGDGSIHFTNLGPQLTARTLQAAAFTKEPDGRDIVCAVVRSLPFAKLLVIDVTTGAVRRTMPLPDANGSWSAVTATDGSVYVGTEATGKLFRYVPGETQARDLGVALTGETFIWSLANGRDGAIFGGTYPGCRVFRYSPETGFSEPLAGPIVAGETYARSIACDAAAQTLYVGVGVKTPHLIEINLATGTRRELLPPGYADDQSVYTLSISGDLLFARLNPSHRTLVFARRTRTVIAELKATGSYQPLASPPSPHDGKIYYAASGELKSFDPKHPQAPPVTAMPVHSTPAMTWLAGPADEPGASLVIFTQSGQIVRHHPPSGHSVITEVISPEEPVAIQSLAAGPDGRIWMGGYLSGGAAAFDPAAGQMEQFKGISQAESITVLGNALYFGVYPRARIFEFDLTMPWDRESENPHQIGIMKDQSRPVAMVGVPELGRVFIGTISEYGLLGGALAEWDLAAQRFETFAHVVPRHSIASLAYADGLIIGGTTVRGGLGVEPAETEGRLFLWDPKTNQKLFETVPVRGKGIVSGLTLGPDGQLWGFAQGALFLFDLKAQRVTHVRELFKADFTGRAMWQDASMLLHPSGDVYAVQDSRFLRIDGRTKEVTILREVPDKKHTRPLAMDAAGRIYLATGAELWRYTP